MSNRKNLQKMSYRDLQDMYRDLARRANWRIEQIGDLRKVSNVFARKYDPMLYGNTIPNIGTKKGMFALAKRGNKANLINRIKAVEGFLNNDFTDVKAVNRYVDELLSRTQLRDKDDLVKLFDLYREMGFDDYKDQSDKIIQIMSEMFNEGYDPERLLRYLDSGEYHDQLEHITALDTAWTDIKMRGNILKGKTKEEIYTMSLNAMQRREDR